MTNRTLADSVVLEGNVKPEDIRTCLIDAVNYGWQLHGEDGRCNVPANFVGWLLQENERLRALLQRHDDAAKKDERAGVDAMWLPGFKDLVKETRHALT